VVTYNSFNLQSGQSGWWISGGTSAGAPQWAGILALADQARAARGLGSLGAAQQTVYTLPTSAFHDVTTGSNGWPATAGYDPATGIGTPIVNLIVADLAGAGSGTAHAASRQRATGKAVIITVVTSLPGLDAGAPTPSGPTAATDPTAVDPNPGSQRAIPTEGTQSHLVVEDPSLGGLAPTLSSTSSQPANAVDPPVPALSPADEVFSILGSTYGKGAESPWALLPARIHSPHSDDVAPEVACSLLIGQEDVRLADGEAPAASEGSAVEAAEG
jgi:hypothetical protein